MALAGLGLTTTTSRCGSVAGATAALRSFSPGCRLRCCNGLPLKETNVHGQVSENGHVCECGSGRWASPLSNQNNRRDGPKQAAAAATSRDTILSGALSSRQSAEQAAGGRARFSVSEHNAWVADFARMFGARVSVLRDAPPLRDSSASCEWSRIWSGGSSASGKTCERLVMVEVHSCARACNLTDRAAHYTPGNRSCSCQESEQQQVLTCAYK